MQSTNRALCALAGQRVDLDPTGSPVFEDDGVGHSFIARGIGVKSDDVIERDLLAEFCGHVLVWVTATRRSKLHLGNLACIALWMLRKMCQIMIRWNFACLLLVIGCRRWGRSWWYRRWGGRWLFAMGGKQQREAPRQRVEPRHLLPP